MIASSCIEITLLHVYSFQLSLQPSLQPGRAAGFCVRNHLLIHPSLARVYARSQACSKSHWQVPVDASPGARTPQRILTGKDLPGLRVRLLSKKKQGKQG